MTEFKHQILHIFDAKGSLQYADEQVTQLQHALQSATLAEQRGYTSPLIVACLLHDIGHIMDAAVKLPESTEENLHDQHEERAYQWLKKNLGDQIAEPVRLHVSAKRYLCTTDRNYLNVLSPTSYKSFLDQGGVMNESELLQFEQNPHHREAIALRVIDDTAKDPYMETPEISHFLNYFDHIA